MNLRNRYLVLTLRTLFGLALILMGVMGLIMDPQPRNELETAMFAGFDALGITYVITAVTLLAGILIISGCLPALGLVLYAPVLVGIWAYHIAHDLATIVPGLIVTIFFAYLVYVYWEKYSGLLSR
jgi:uncharacterized membrane protein YphA (DoxX/SURF4 family)